jgi:deoxyribodipyrimidine photolyase-related protein
MRDYRDELKKNNYQVYYDDFQEKNRKDSFIKKLDEYLKNTNFKKVKIHEIEDHFFEKELISFLNKKRIETTIIPSPMFLTSRDSFSEYLKTTKKPFMKTFYQNQRRKHDILIKNDKPIGGKWSFDEENRKKLPKGLIPPEIKTLPKSKNYVDVLDIVETYFSKNPGSTENFIYPTTQKDALKLLNDFITNRFQHFGAYEDALHSDYPFNYHSLLSASMNIGHLPPKLILKKINLYLKKNEIPLNSLEGYIRQVIGWREFIRGIYHEFDDIQQEKNFFNHKKGLTESWYDGTTGIEPVDNVIKNINKYGYAHHIERLMVLSNMMLLCEIHPQQVFKWFMEMFVDSSDWVMGPNVFGMGQFSDGGIFATKPYICGSNYILKMSNYKKGDWCDVVDGLYWSFIDNKRDFFKKNPRMSMMVNLCDKMPKEKRERLFKAKDNFIKKHTTKEYL